jgi:hypothetical protein
LEDDNLVFKNNLWQTLVKINKSWEITKYFKTTFEINLENKDSNIEINISDWETHVWSFWFNFINSKINISRDDILFQNKLKNLKNSILVNLKTSKYFSKNNWKVISYNDPFTSTNNLDTFSSNNQNWFENFSNLWWIWWKDWNKSLLSFSAWKTLWESTKDYMSFSLINLWDPVISLKKIKRKFDNWKEKNFDRTIWKLLLNDNDIQSYWVFDYDNDKKEDILIVKSNWYFSLLENKKTPNSNFLNKWNLAYAIDLWSKHLVKTWDFTWDWFSDIFFVDTLGEANIFNNHKKDFVRLSLKDEFKIDWIILRAEVFDMDNDSKDDIVTLDDNWDIHIFYGNWTALNPKFTKLKVADWYGLSLNWKSRSDNWVVYVSGLLQLDDKSTIKTWTWDISSKVLDNMIFENVSYDPLDKEYDIWSDYNNLILDNNTTFIKSEYSENIIWLSVEKTFNDINKWVLKTWDILEVEIILKNKTNKTLKNIAYWEKIKNIFELDKESIEIISHPNPLPKWERIKQKINYDIPGINFFIDKRELKRWESIKIKYKVKTRPLKYWFLKVWLFEKDELWDDLYWDIILKKDEQNCSEPVEIIRSQENINSRSYKKWIKNISCNNEAVKLPEDLEKNTIDLNNNWVPDYIDKLSDTSKIKEEKNDLKDFAKDKLKDINDTTKYNSSRSSEDKMEWFFDDVDNIMAWLSCGFWGWSCIATPLNWAPLAPGWDPTLFWYPIWDWLKVWEWIPIISWLTWVNVFTPGGCYQVPTIWPASPFAFRWACNFSLWAWWILWTTSPSNFFRLFVTPTLTGWVWLAACFGWPPILAWYSNPPWLHPLVPAWNCVVAAAPLFWCKWDWSEWDVSSIWQVDYFWDFGLINWNCKRQTTVQSNYVKLKSDFSKKYYNYKKTWNASSNLSWNIKQSLKDIANPNLSTSDSSTIWPLINIKWNWWEWYPVDIEIDTDALKNWNFSDVLKIKKNRIPSFPWFLMDWVTRQVEEIANKLTDFPTVFIILPDYWNWADNSGNSDEISWSNINLGEKIWKTKFWKTIKRAESWIKEAYEFLSNIPLVKLKKETVNINIPWIDKETINKTLASWWKALEQWKEEITRAKKDWSSIPENSELKTNLFLDADNLINSLEKNIEVIEEYKKLPEKLNKWFNVKERYLEQIMCNVDTISKITWWWINENGKRFKAWVELYILIKAILKSWQLLVDIFIDYEAECHECKNERGDLMTFIWKIIWWLIPKIPIIQFPKWPDIILDLHNVRAGLDIALPEFNISNRPIVLPEPPILKLPKAPDINVNIELGISLPKLPILPSIELPELPDLPSLPKIELPDLPPPPKLPKMFGALEWMLDILKLITKLMCILKSSPFVPEWRAGDQIAYLTERSWYLSMDFLNLELPQFSFPFVDAIKVTTYVNLEFETDFIVEMARAVANPINSFWNNLVPKFEIDLDFSDSIKIPDNIDINIWKDWIDAEIWKTSDNKNMWLLIMSITKNINKLHNYIDENKNETLNNLDFKKEINKNLASLAITSNPKMDGIREVWEEVNNMTYSKENKLIDKLSKLNKDKFETVKDIINTEIINNKKQKKLIEDYSNNRLIKVTNNTFNTPLELYNSKLKPFNKEFKKSLNNLLNTENKEKNNLKKEKNILLTKLTAGITPSKNNSNTPNSCKAQANSEYRYTYNWLYVIQDKKSYKLFDYIDELDWKEETKVIDFDLDWDSDILYLANNSLYLKENLSKLPSKNYITDSAIILDSDDNIFYNSDIFYESVNNFRESNTSNEAIDISFSNSTRVWEDSIYNYRLEFYNRIDKFIAESDTSYRPEYIKKNIIDSFSDIENITLKSNNNSIIRDNLSYINKIWQDTKWLKLYTKSFKNIRDNLINNNIVSISVWTKIYSTKNPFVLYYEDDNKLKHTITLAKNSNIEFKQKINITWISGNAYIEDNDIIVSWENIRKYLWFPLFPNSKIILDENNIEKTEKSHIEITHYDKSETLIDFRDTISYEIYNLWYSSSQYNIRLNKNNDFYYAKIKWFKKNLFSTTSNQILLSPQIQADINSPELSLSNYIKIPVYQKQVVDLTDYIYEDAWIKNISEVFIDFDLEIDSDGDWNFKNDKDNLTDDKINIRKTSSRIDVEFWKYDNIFSKKIWITVIDKQWNTWYSDVNFLIYTPTPKINSYNSGIIKWNIDESFTDEPINLYRFRSWIITKLINKDDKVKVNTKLWNYDFEVNNNSRWLALKKDTKIVAYINEETWKIDLKDISLSVKVLESNEPNNESIYPKIIISKLNENIFYEYLKVSNVSRVKLASDFDSKLTKGIYIKLLDNTGFWYYSIPENAPYNPGSLSIYRKADKNKSELFTIFNDWRINTLNWYYKLKYSSLWDYIVIELIDKHFNKTIWEVLFKIEGESVLR